MDRTKFANDNGLDAHWQQYLRMQEKVVKKGKTKSQQLHHASMIHIHQVRPA
jgi:hypothetical protein